MQQNIIITICLLTAVLLRMMRRWNDHSILITDRTEIIAPAADSAGAFYFESGLENKNKEEYRNARY